MAKTTLIIGIIIFISSLSRADVWPLPSIKRYYSQNRKYMLKVTPTIIPDKYWKWRSAKPKRKKRFKAKDTTIIRCHATLFKVSVNDTVKVWTQNLINRIAPMAVIVADDGKSIVTFDNWASMGYGMDVMVIYDQNGGLVMRYKLEEISPFPLNEYLMSVSSIWWQTDASYIDNDRIKICFSKENGDSKTRIFDVKQFKFILPNELRPKDINEN